MAFEKGHEVGKATRWQPGESGNPSGRPPDPMRALIHTELEKIMVEGTGSQSSRTKLEVLTERIVDDAIDGCLVSRKMLVDRLYPAPAKIQLSADDGEARLRVQRHDAARKLDRILGLSRLDEAQDLEVIEAEGIIVCPVHPGWVRTDMGGPQADISTEESVAGIIRLIDSLETSQTGRFWTWDGREHPW